MLAELSSTIAIAAVWPPPQSAARLESAGRARPAAIRTRTATRTINSDMSSMYFRRRVFWTLIRRNRSVLNGTILGLAAMDQVQQDRNQPGQRGQQEERGGEGHGRVRFSR